MHNFQSSTYNHRTATTVGSHPAQSPFCFPQPNHSLQAQVSSNIPRSGGGDCCWSLSIMVSSPNQSLVFRVRSGNSGPSRSSSFEQLLANIRGPNDGAAFQCPGQTLTADPFSSRFSRCSCYCGFLESGFVGTRASITGVLQGILAGTVLRSLLHVSTQWPLGPPFPFPSRNRV